jgi:hypothetical protein
MNQQAYGAEEMEINNAVNDIIEKVEEIREVE